MRGGEGGGGVFLHLRYGLVDSLAYLLKPKNNALKKKIRPI